MKYPETVPILSANDICRYSLSRHGKHCLRGWQQTVFGDYDSTPISDVDKALTIACGTREIMTFTDTPRRKLSVVARAWNRAMALLGYVVGNPERKWAAKRKVQAKQ